jgi:hypothetical protein
MAFRFGDDGPHEVIQAVEILRLLTEVREHEDDRIYGDAEAVALFSEDSRLGVGAQCRSVLPPVLPAAEVAIDGYAIPGLFSTRKARSHARRGGTDEENVIGATLRPSISSPGA